MKTWCLLWCFVVLALSLGVKSDAGDLRLVSNGKSDYSIVLSTQASPSENHAALELQKFLKEISGAELPIVIKSNNLPKHMILLGDSSPLRSLKTAINFKSLGDEGFAIRTVGPHIVIAGGRLRGTMYGMYTFLEDVLGCRWYSTYVSKIPHKPSLTIKPLNIVQVPDFEYREPHYTGTFDPDWAARSKVNSRFFSNFGEARGGGFEWGCEWFCHTMEDLIPTSEFFEQHPEYYAMLNGKRVGGRGSQLCLSNPNIAPIVAGKIFWWMKKYPVPNVWSITQNDNWNQCQCDNCKAMDKAEGSAAGTYLRFVNAVADIVGKKYPNVRFVTWGYNYTFDPPLLTKPRPNVIILVNRNHNCHVHPVATCEEDAHIMEAIRGWKKLTNNLYLWNYPSDVYNYLMPYPTLNAVSVDIPMYKRLGFSGIFLQGSGWAGNGPWGGAGWMDDLQAYLQAKLLWNSRLDPHAVITDFLDGYFGKAGKPIGEFLTLLENKVSKEHIHGHIEDMPDNAKYLTPEIMTQGNKLFDEAEKVADNPEILHRVRHSRLSLEWVDLYREIKRCSANGTPDERAAAKSHLFDFAARCKADGAEVWREGQSIDGWAQALTVGL